MTWEKSRKPFTGLHWWYRILTGVWYSYPHNHQQDYKVYWKTKAEGKEVECRLLNWLFYLECLKDRIMYRIYWKFYKNNDNF